MDIYLHNQGHFCVRQLLGIQEPVYEIACTAVIARHTGIHVSIQGNTLPKDVFQVYCSHFSGGFAVFSYMVVVLDVLCILCHDYILPYNLQEESVSGHHHIFHLYRYYGKKYIYQGHNGVGSVAADPGKCPSEGARLPDTGLWSLYTHPMSINIGTVGGIQCI